jgi:hypothetical protein
MKKTVKKLSLNQETLRKLDDKALAEIQGGASLVCGDTAACSLATKACSTCCL